MVDDSNRPSLQDQTPDLSVIVLCYHAGEPIKLLVQRLIDALVGSGVPTFELVLVANDWPGSTDQTAKIVSALAIADTRLVPVIERKEGMMGWDVRQGLRRAHGNVLAIFEGDGQVAPVELIRAYNLLRRGSYDIVKTYRAARPHTF